MIYNVMLASGIEESDSYIYIYYIYMCVCVSILFQILSPFKLLHNIEDSSLCYIVGPCWLSILK